MINDNNDNDNHMCIRCKQTITGLNNYITHRKRNHCQHISANAFFNCLELQHANDDNDDNDEHIDDDHYDHIDIDIDIDTDTDVDIWRPPRHFTGAKWKPGCAPFQTNTYNNCDYECIDHLDDLVVNANTNTNTRPKAYHINDINDINDSSVKSFQNIDNYPNTHLNSDTLINKLSENNGINGEIGVNSVPNRQLSNAINDDNVIKCLVCSFTSNSLFNTLKHCLDTNSHLNHISIEMRNCLAQFLIETQLILMRKLLFACSICCFYTNESNNFIWHITTKQHTSKLNASDHSIGVYQCVHCDLICDNIEKLMEHLKSKQNIHINSCSPLINCIVLPKSKLIKPNVKKNVNLLKCEFCEKKFKFKKHVKLHTIREHTRKLAFPQLIKTTIIGNTGKYSCNDCGFKTDCESTQLLHSINHSLPVGSNNQNVKRNNDKYKCPVCDHIYLCRELKKHIHTHTETKPYNCSKCGKSFAKKNGLNSHQKLHVGLKNKICSVCGAGFVLNKVLKRHMKIHDINRERNLKCDICGASFFSNNILQLHVKRHLPKDQREFKCLINGCGFAFVQKSELTEHQKVHSDPNDKPLLCDRCPYKTRSIFTFRKHYRQHTGYKPFKCEFCDYTTGLSSNLSRHKRTHTGDKPYKCPHCSYTCNTQENVRKHILKTKKHNGLFVYPCNHCSYATNIFTQYLKHVKEQHSSFYTQKQMDNFSSHLFVKNSTTN